MPVIDSGRKYNTQDNFVIEIDGVTEVQFATCSEIKGEVAVTEYNPGGSLTAHKLPGRISFPDITLTRGSVALDSEIYQWFNEVVNGVANSGANEPLFKRTMDIVQIDRDRSEVTRWRLRNCWLSSFSTGAFDGSAGEVLMESMTVVFEGFEKIIP